MNENRNIKLSETVVVIDAAFLNHVVVDLKRYFEGKLGRKLHEMDLSLLATYLTLDAGIMEGNNTVQFLFVYDKDSEQLAHCRPCDLKEELNGVAFTSKYGEYLFAGVPCEGLVSRGDLYLDLLTIVADSSDVKKMLVVSFNEEYGEKVTAILGDTKEKEIIQFRMNEPEVPVNYRWEMLAFPIMQALGIRGDEL